MTTPTPEEPSARRLLATALEAGLPYGWQVTGYPTTLDNVTRPTVMVWTSRLEPSNQIGRDRVMVTLDVWVLTGITAPGQADDALDAQLLAVLAVLHGLEWIDWTSAERGVLEDKYHGYRLSTTAVLKIGD